MTNKEIYELAYSLWMIDDNREEECCSEEEYETNPYYRMSLAERFEVDSKDIVKVTRFVNELTSYNDLETLKQFLICLISNNARLSQ